MRERRNYLHIFSSEKLVEKHRGNSVFLFDQKEEENLTKTYKNGQKCGQISEDLQMQRCLSNPLLLNRHKFDFRLFMVIASVNSLIDTL